MTHADDRAAGPAMERTLADLEGALCVLEAQARAQEATLADLADAITRSRRCLSELPDGSRDKRSLTGALGAARVEFLRLRGDQDQIWAEVGQRRRALARTRRMYLAAHRER